MSGVRIASSARNSERSNNKINKSKIDGLLFHNSKSVERAPYAPIKLSSRVTTRSGSDNVGQASCPSPSLAFFVAFFPVNETGETPVLRCFGHIASNRANNFIASSIVREDTCT